MVVSRRFAPQLALVADSLDTVRIVVVYDAEPDDEHVLEARFRVLTGEEFLADAEPLDGLAEPQLWDIMSVIYTSGTTGQAKAVLQPWGMQELVRLLFAPPEFDETVFYGFWPPFHSLGKSAFFVPTVRNGKLVLRERFSIGDFWNDVRTYGCTAAPTSSASSPASCDGQPPRDDDADNPLKAVVMGPVIPEVDDFKRRFGVNVYTTFGSTEIGSVLFSFMRDLNGTNWQSCGRIAPDSPVEVAVVDDHDYPVGSGVPGELVIRPKRPWSCSMGYLNMPEASIRAFRNGWYHTGDTFVRDEDGEHYFVDRAKDYIRRRGENISSFEVEQAVCGFPGVGQAVAVAVPSEDGEDEVMVFIVCEPGASVEPLELVDFLSTRVPKFAVAALRRGHRRATDHPGHVQGPEEQAARAGPGPNTFDRLADVGLKP